MTKPPTSPLPFARISLKWSMIEAPELNIAETLAMLAELGYDGVEIDAPTDMPLDDLIAASTASGVALPGVINARHWSHPLSSPDAETRAAGVNGMVAALETARTIGAETVLLVPGVVSPEVSYAAAWDRAIAGVEQLLPHAERTGVRIAIENVWNNFLLSPLEAAAFLDHFDHPLLGWYLDIGNILRNGYPTDWIEVLGERICRVDLKEYSRSKMDAEGPWKGFDIELGEGDCDWPAVNAALRGIGYSGWASVEVPGGGRARLAEIRARVEALRVL
ncbi:sugar phosphate isomerase/epimerase [Yangia mangrovi]|uniref:Sugar phosphate isomerase/epimerase n=2 Tax=Alloyangia mangrovi TaxID=1779329 RepID=A0ABT2KMD0_9RHOB|nr:sugar phosphate isomerase/epimerase family protein [Alloyangia mangrovi]MCT4371315.1 sugar phosphate isomerase/epimerase [Alloyangia mangrovi]